MVPRPTKVLVWEASHWTNFSTSRFVQNHQETFGADALNASLPISEYRTCYGGCGGNIAFGLGTLGVPTVLLSHAGCDFLPGYRDHLLSRLVDCQFVAVDPATEFSARCTILSDDHGNQITGFYPGNADSSLRASAATACMRTGADFAVLGPESPALMIKQGRELDSADIPFVFDPGQWVSEFTQEELEEMLDFRPMIFANEHEVEVLIAKLSMTLETLSARVPLLIRTRGSDGLDLYRTMLAFHKSGQAQCNSGYYRLRRRIPAGFIYGLAQGRDAISAARIGTIVAAKSISHKDPQGWSIKLAELQ